MISRLPNIRASTEKAPGPSPMIVNNIVKPKMSDVLESKRFVRQAGNSDKPAANVPGATTAATTGVSSPINKRPPAQKSASPSVHAVAVGLEAAM